VIAAPKSAEQTPRLRRSIWLAIVFVGTAALGMVLAHPLAALLRTSAPWVFPSIVVAVLTILVVFALTVLPMITARRS
jgi:MFS family permease